MLLVLSMQDLRKSSTLSQCWQLPAGTLALKFTMDAHNAADHQHLGPGLPIGMIALYAELIPSSQYWLPVEKKHTHL